MTASDQVSVVIPYFNSHLTVSGALSSLLEGSRPPDEIVVVDDGSERESAEALRQAVSSLGDKRIRIENLDSNCGGGFARNVGIQTASFDTLFMLDSDNLVGADLLGRLLEAKNQNPERHVFGPERFLFFPDDGSARISHYWAMSQKPPTLADLLKMGPVPGASGNYLFTKESWMKSGGYPTQSQSLDTWGFGWRQLVAGYAPQIVPDTHYFHRVSGDSYWSRDSRDMKNMSLRATSLVLESSGRIPKSLTLSVLGRKRGSTWYAGLKVPGSVKNKQIQDSGFQVTRDAMDPLELETLERELQSILTGYSTADE